VEALQQLSNHAALPDFGSSVGVWCYFAASIVTAPAVLLLFGSLLAVFESPLSSCCQPSLRSSSDAVSSKAAGRRLLAALSLVVVVLGAGVTIASVEGLQSYEMFASDLERSLHDLHRADRLASSISETGTGALASVANLVGSCPADVQPFMKKAIESSLKTGRHYLSVARDYSASISNLNAVAPVAKSHLELVGLAVITLAALPFLSVFAALVAVGFAVSVSWRQAHGKRARGPSRLASCCIALTPSIMLFVSGLAAMNLLLGNSMAAVCVAPSSTFLSYPREILGFNSTGYKISQYYLEGRGELQASTCLVKADVLLSGLVGNLEEYSKDLKELCGGWDAAVHILRPQLQIIQDDLTECQSLISPKNIYPYWDVTIYDNLCGAATRSIFTIVFFQVLLAFFCLPLLTAIAKNLLAHLVAEARSRELEFKQADLALPRLLGAKEAWKTYPEQEEFDDKAVEVVVGRVCASSPEGPEVILSVVPSFDARESLKAARCIAKE